MVTFDSASIRVACARSAAAFVPFASSVVVRAAKCALSFMPHPRPDGAFEVAFVDQDTESLVSAILGDAPSEHWATGEETMLPIEEKLAFEPMPEFDHLPASFC